MKEKITQSLSEGILVPGNINLQNRPIVKNPDGTISTIRSISFNENGKEILIPTVIGNKIVSDEEAIKEYERTGKHLGIFDSPESATKYAKNLSKEQGMKTRGLNYFNRARGYYEDNRYQDAWDMLKNIFEEKNFGNLDVSDPEVKSNIRKIAFMSYISKKSLEEERVDAKDFYKKFDMFYKNPASFPSGPDGIEKVFNIKFEGPKTKIQSRLDMPQNFPEIPSQKQENLYKEARRQYAEKNYIDANELYKQAFKISPDSPLAETIKVGIFRTEKRLKGTEGISPEAKEFYEKQSETRIARRGENQPFKPSEFKYQPDAYDRVKEALSPIGEAVGKVAEGLTPKVSEAVEKITKRFVPSKEEQ